jgi:hypothetical protein
MVDYTRPGQQEGTVPSRYRRCEVEVHVDRERRGVFNAILRLCFPSVDQAAEDAALRYEGWVPAYGVRYFFREEHWLAMLAELKTLSRSMPEVRFVLKYGDYRPHKGEGMHADDNNTVIGEATFVAGEVEKFVGPEDHRMEVTAAPCLGSQWLRGQAERLQASVFSESRRAGEVGRNPESREGLNRSLRQSAYQELKSRLDGIDQRILDTFQDCYEQVLQLNARRCNAANAREQFEDVLNWAAEEGSSAAVLEPAELEQLQAANRVLEKIAGGVPARSKWV